MKKLKRILGLIIILTLVIVQIVMYSRVVNRKSDEIKYDMFFEQEEDFEVLFMGSSHVLNGVFPMELWNDYGIVSYNMGGHGCTIPLSYWVLKNALEYTTPKLVVIDGYFIEKDIKHLEEIGYAHISLDAFPLTETKTEAINDLCGTKETKIEFLWEFSLYHNRWSEISEGDINYELSKEMGAESRIGIAKANEYDLDKNEYLEYETVAMEYMGKIIELCQSNDIEVLLTYLPFPVDSYAEANSMKLIAEEYGVNYINFLETEVVNFKTDCYDENSHLNPSGARKVTDYLGKFITENYNIANQKDNLTYASKWDEYYQVYEQYKADIFSKAELNNQLMLMYDDSFNGGIYIPDVEEFLGEALHRELLLNLGVDFEQLQTDDWGFIYIDNTTNKITYVTETNQSEMKIVRNQKSVEIEIDEEVSVVFKTHENEDAYCFIVRNTTGDVITSKELE